MGNYTAQLNALFIGVKSAREKTNTQCERSLERMQQSQGQASHVYRVLCTAPVSGFVLTRNLRDTASGKILDSPKLNVY